MSQARAAEDLPVMAVDRAHLEAWTRSLMLISEGVREMRDRTGRRRWSDSETASLDHDDAQRSAQPATVRPLTSQEAEQWRTGTAEQAEQHTAFDPSTGRGLRVRCGPVEDGRWVVDAEVHQLGPDATPIGDPLAHAAVSCASEQHARDLTAELLNAGPDPLVLARLLEHSFARAARQTAAAGEVREDDAVRLDRTRTAIREHWHPELAGRVIASRKAFEPLAWRLHQLEEQGVPMSTVLVRLSQNDLMKPTVRDPAALAEWMCENLLTVIDGEVIATPAQNHADQARGAARGRTPHSGPRPAAADQTAGYSPFPADQARDTGATSTTTAVHDPAVVDDAWRQAMVEDTVWPALRAALPEPVCLALRKDTSGYQRLVDDLAAKHATGWHLEALLAKLPDQRIQAANGPARYLLGVVSRRSQESAPAKTGIDKVAMAHLVHQAFPDDLATKITEKCPAWPRLATRMAHAEATANSGDPSLVELLRDMPTGAIRHARKPAAYTATLLDRTLAARRGESAIPTPERARLGEDRRLNPASAIDRIALEDAPTSDAQTSFATQSPIPDRPAAAQVLRAAELVVSKPALLEGLGLANAMRIDMDTCNQLVGELVALGVLSPRPSPALRRGDIWDEPNPWRVTADPEQLDRLRATVTEQDTSHISGQPSSKPTVTAGPDLAAAAAHQHAAEQDNGIADDAEVDAGTERASGNSSRDRSGEVRVDDNLAAAYRAGAAEEIDAATAAALRAQVVLTPPSNRDPSTQTTPARTVSSPAAPLRTTQVNRRRGPAR